MYQHVASASALHSATPAQATGPPCGFCHKPNHTSDKCYFFVRTPIEFKAEKACAAKLCIKCLKGDHMFVACKGQCSFCQGAHHHTMCFKKANYKPPSTGPPNGTDKGKGQVAVMTASSVTSSSFHVGVTVNEFGQHHTVLQTAKVKVLDGQGNKVIAQILFDGGSDRSYVSSHFLKKIKPHWAGSEELTNNTFGGHRTDNVCNLFNLYLSTLKGNLVTLPVAEVPKIAAPLNRYKVPKHLLNEFKDIQWADGYDNMDHLVIDILIGQNFIYEFQTLNMRGRPDCLVATETIFGWILFRGQMDYN